MKRALICIIILVLAFSLVGCGTIASEKAIDIALADMGITRVAAAKTDAILNKEDDPATYKVILDMNDHFVNYYINAKTGEIISKETLAK